MLINHDRHYPGVVGDQGVSAVSIGMRKWMAVAAIVVVAIPGVVWAATTFTDLDETHPQYDDIAYAVEQGWFAGYPDGTFRPDRRLTTRQAVTVFERAFPQGVSRADLASILRAGEERLTATSTTAATSDDVWCAADDSYCLEEARWLPRQWRDPHRLTFRFRTNQACPGGWYVEVRLVGSPHSASDEKRYSVREGETLTIWFVFPSDQFPSYTGSEWGSVCRA